MCLVSPSLPLDISWRSSAALAVFAGPRLGTNKLDTSEYCTYRVGKRPQNPFGVLRGLLAAFGILSSSKVSTRVMQCVPSPHPASRLAVRTGTAA